MRRGGSFELRARRQTVACRGGKRSFPSAESEGELAIRHKARCRRGYCSRLFLSVREGTIGPSRHFRLGENQVLRFYYALGLHVHHGRKQSCGRQIHPNHHLVASRPRGISWRDSSRGAESQSENYLTAAHLSSNHEDASLQTWKGAAAAQ